MVNFLRGSEPRGPVDLLLPAQKQMEVIARHGLPATWLLQFDALVSGPYARFLKEQAPKDHEVGIWFEMNEMHCRAANVPWRGRAGYEWDWTPSVAFTIGYSPDERVKLAEAFMSEFRSVWGHYPRSVASWNLDAITVAHLADRYGVDAFAVCRDQIATDGFTIWGAPIAGYLPSRTNCWSPALDHSNQIGAPVFRMLGQDPVYYFESSYPLPDGRRVHSPDTIEPVWPSGRSPEFIRNFLGMIESAPALGFSYAQLGQENNFGWPEMAEAYPKQMQALAELRRGGRVHVETMSETGRRFKHAFRATPAQAQVLLRDPFGNARAERTIWYQSRFYRANLHIAGDLPFLRDLTVYSDRFPQPFLHEATRDHEVEQRLPAALDGYHWSLTPGSAEPGAGGFFIAGGERLRLAGDPHVREEGQRLVAELPVTDGRTLRATFDERKIAFELSPPADLTLSFEWDSARAAFVRAEGRKALYKWQGFDYSLESSSPVLATEDGWSTAGRIVLTVAQTAQS